MTKCRSIDESVRTFSDFIYRNQSEMVDFFCWSNPPSVLEGLPTIKNHPKEEDEINENYKKRNYY